MKRFLRISKVFIKIVFFLAIVLMLSCAVFLYYLSSHSYKPLPKESLNISGKGYFSETQDSMMSLLTWNIGYCALGKEMDFFYDGGTHVRPDKDLFKKYLTGIMNFLAANDTIDMMLLQEVDTSSGRSYYTNEYEMLKQFLPIYYSAFAKNYDAEYVPFPLSSPMGQVVSGLCMFSKIKPIDAYRQSFYASYSWPKSLFMLQRCMIITRYKMFGGKQLVVINIHNSAFADAAMLREAESMLIKAIILDEYARGNYVIAGGDWNQNPPGYNRYMLKGDDNNTIAEPAIAKDFLPMGWQWAYDKNYTTNRNVDKAYVKGKTPTSTLDFFVVSPNLDIVECRVLTKAFDYSDHRPLFLRVKIKPEKKIETASEKEKPNLNKKKKGKKKSKKSDTL